MQKPLRNTIVSRSAWTAADLQSDQSWMHALSNDEPLEANLLSRICAELREGGRGLFLLRGLSLEGGDRERTASSCVGLAKQLGRLLPQNLEGDLIRWVEDQDKYAANECESKGHRGRAAMLPHCDSADVACLFCVRPAKLGGATTVASAGAIFNRIAEHYPEHLKALHAGFYFDLTGKSPEGVSERRCPVFESRQDGVSCRFNKSRIEAGMKHRGIALSDAEEAALECINALALRPDLAFRLILAPGDALFFANRRVLHAREAFEDWPETQRKRLLLRVWIEM